MKTGKKTIMVADDDAHIRRLVSLRLSKAGYHVQSAATGMDAFKIIAGDHLPDLIILDVMMPEMDGYEVCGRLKESPKVGPIPIVFFTSLETEKDRAKAFLAGGTDFISKTAPEQVFLKKIRHHIDLADRWQGMKGGLKPRRFYDLSQFKVFLRQASELDLDDNTLKRLTSSTIYDCCSNQAELAKVIARFTQNTYMGNVEMDQIALGELSASFCQTNSVIPLKQDVHGGKAFLISNPFDMEMVGQLERLGREQNIVLFIAEPEVIKNVFIRQKEIKIMALTVEPEDEEDAFDTEEDTAPPDSIIIGIVDMILRRAINLNVSDIHIEPKEGKYIVRFRVDGSMVNFPEFSMTLCIGNRVLSRFKILGKMNISERRVPQDGVFRRHIDGKKMKFRLSTGPAFNGETMVIRLIDQTAKPPELTRLGMGKAQAEQLITFAEMPDKMILLVGVTGSGKSTTIRATLEHASDERRCVLSIENPVEGVIPHAVQLEINEKAGATWEKLLRAMMRQDPDVIVIGEIRDRISASIAVEASLTGHLVISTLHSAGGAEAIRRLEDLGISRKSMSDAIRCVVAQTLCRRLCPFCKKIETATSEMQEKMRLFSDEIIMEVGTPVGCRRCRHTGYSGRTGIYEVLYFDETIRKMIRDNVPVAEIKHYFRENGGTVISHNAVQKVKSLECSPHDIWGILLKEKDVGFV